MTMGAWTSEELSRFGEAEELQLASERADQTFRRYVTMWVVGVGGDLYVRSAAGPDNPWYPRGVASGVGRIRAGGVERDVTFSTPTTDVHAAIRTTVAPTRPHRPGPGFTNPRQGDHP